MPSTSPARASNDTSLTTWWPRGSTTVTLRTSSTDVADLGGVLVDGELDLAADHHLGELGLGGGRRGGADDLAAADHA